MLRFEFKNGFNLLAICFQTDGNRSAPNRDLVDAGPTNVGSAPAEIADSGSVSITQSQRNGRIESVNSFIYYRSTRISFKEGPTGFRSIKVSFGIWEIKVIDGWFPVTRCHGKLIRFARFSEISVKLKRLNVFL